MQNQIPDPFSNDRIGTYWLITWIALCAYVLAFLHDSLLIVGLVHVITGIVTFVTFARPRPFGKWHLGKTAFLAMFTVIGIISPLSLATSRRRSQVIVK